MKHNHNHNNAPNAGVQLVPVRFANPFGGRNSVLHVASSPEAAHLYDAETVPLKKETAQKTKNI